MAYDKIIPIKTRLDHCLRYALNHEKTGLSVSLEYVSNSQRHNGTMILETALNCQLETAYQEMAKTKYRWDKRGGVLGYHLIHSFAPGEVTAQEAHSASLEYAKRLLGERFEAVIATHIDHDHFHTHIVFNSVSFVDGKKFRNDFRTYYGNIRETSNAVSKERNLSVISPRGKGKHYAEWNAKQQGKPSMRDLIRQDIDTALSKAVTLKSFWTELKRQGYQIKQGTNIKHIAVKPPGSERYFRLDGLGESYTEGALLNKLSAARRESKEEKPLEVKLPIRYYRFRSKPKVRSRLHGFRALYFRYLYLIGKQYKRKPLPFALRMDALKLDQLIEQFRFLQEHRIDTDSQLKTLSASLQNRINKLITDRKTLYREKSQGLDIEQEIERVNETLRSLRCQLRVCTRIENDIPVIRGHLRQYQTAAESPVPEENKYGKRRKSHGRER